MATKRPMMGWLWFMNSDGNIVLVGMAGCGKSTVGMLLAEKLSRPFIDTDDLIEAGEGKCLQDILDEIGTSAFRDLEEGYVLSLDCAGHVIATGGSVVYSESAMNHLKTIGTIVYLDLPLDFVRPRLANLDSRGFVIEPDQTLADVYAERLPLYGHYADIEIDCRDLTDIEIAAIVLDRLPA